MSNSTKEYIQTSKYDSEKKSGKIKTYCNDCGIKTQHSILSTTKLKTSFESYIDYHNIIETWLLEEYQIIQCRGCENIHFRHTHIFSEEIFEPNMKPHEYIYPASNQERDTIKNIELLPSNLIDIYTETIQTFNANSCILAGVGIRSIIETICKEQEVAGKNLKQKIDNLVINKILTPADAKILHIFRNLGNDATHDVKSHTSKQLGIALDVIEHLIIGLYILPYHTSNNFS